MAEMDKRRRALTIPNLLSAFRILLISFPILMLNLSQPTLPVNLFEF